MDEPSLEVPKAVLESRGGFAWWYAEIMSGGGDGCVLIWSYGLPFLPDWESKVRRGEADLPRQRPSLNVAMYRDGKPVGYVLHEFKPEAVFWDGAGRWRFGESELVVTEEEDRRRLDIQLACPVVSSGGVFEGRITLEGHRPYWTTPIPDSTSPHRWVPMMTGARGTVDLQMDDGTTLRAEGHAYHDRNWSTASLGALGIREWRWGHLVVENTERVMYRLVGEREDQPLCFGVEMKHGGALEYAPNLLSEDSGVARTTWGISCPQRWASSGGETPWMDLQFDNLVDDGPFYLRGVTSGTITGHQGVGSAEIIRVGHIDLARHRPLVRMRVASDQRRNSMWLPLFEGSHKNPLGRLLRSWTKPLGGQLRV